MIPLGSFVFLQYFVYVFYRLFTELFHFYTNELQGFVQFLYNWKWIKIWLNYTLLLNLFLFLSLFSVTWHVLNMFYKVKQLDLCYVVNRTLHSKCWFTHHPAKEADEVSWKLWECLVLEATLSVFIVSCNCRLFCEELPFASTHTLRTSGHETLSKDFTTQPAF